MNAHVSFEIMLLNCFKICVPNRSTGNQNLSKSDRKTKRLTDLILLQLNYKLSYELV